jgi:hypothetical protein
MGILGITYDYSLFWSCFMRSTVILLPLKLLVLLLKITKFENQNEKLKFEKLPGKKNPQIYDV